MTRIYSHTTVEPITEKTARDWWSPRKDEFRVTMLALEDNKAIGYWDLERETWMKPGRFFIKVIVTPEFRNRKLGAQMYAEALRAAREQGATELESRIREDDVISNQFAEKRGFKIEFHFFESKDSASSLWPKLVSPTRTSISCMRSTAMQPSTTPAIAEAFPISTPSQKTYSTPHGSAPIPRSSLLSRTVGWVSPRSAFILRRATPTTPSPEYCAITAALDSPRH